MNLAKNKNLLIGLGVIVLAAVVYFVFFNGSSTADVTTNASPSSAAELYFVNLAGELGTISFNTKVFSDPRFSSLVDIQTEVVPEVSGRPDPFAPIPGLKVSKQ
jgi:hypothetical protein